MEQLVLIIALVIGSFVIGYILGLHNRKPERSEYDGSLEVSASDTSQIYQFELTVEPEELSKKKAITFEVKKI